ncbi:hypothetical protein TCAL_14433 [Tigriopus californicus]|uniref:Fibronectin type-II domain-containing protein n=1 Tax=Tigriopus californicus TaxID=6832 RepID=A0A553PLT5_TIGCA|nr:hypothetical protein TCAL_14433 [Tigriopus californicus]
MAGDQPCKKKKNVMIAGFVAKRAQDSSSCQPDNGNGTANDLPLNVDRACNVVSNRCDFPFELEGEEHNTCVPHENSAELVCRTTPSENSDRWSWSVCGEGCFEDEAPLNFSDPAYSPVSSFCKNKAVECVFPFTYNGDSFDTCTSVDTEFSWCATLVDSDGNMVENFWGECDAGCSLGAESQFQYEDVVGDLALEQADPGSPLTIKGQITGVTVPGSHAFRVVNGSLENGNCSTIFGDPEGTVSFGPFSSTGDGPINVDLDTSDVSLYGEDSILNQILVVFSAEGENEVLIGCGPIVEPSWDLTLIIIIVLVVVIVLLLLLIVCLCCCCCRKKKNKKNKLPNDETDLPYSNGTSKKPLYDELSIPFIDASPAPTPKTGRSVERLSFFHRSSSVARSRGSLSHPPLYPPPPPPGASTHEINWKGTEKNGRKYPV